MNVKLMMTGVAGLFAMTILAQAPSTQPERKRPAAPSRDEMIAKAATYLKGSQADDGTWSKTTHPGITGVVLIGLLKADAAKAADPIAAKGLKFVETLVDPKEGHIAVGDGIRHKFYTTSVNVQALAASKDAKYDAVIRSAANYLKKGQVGSADGKPQTDVNFGGFGYAPDSRGDLSNTHFALDALLAAQTPMDDPVFKRAVVFVSRMQNFKSEHNDQPWAGAINDGSFIYVAGGGPGGNAPAPDAARPGYGSMTYAGLKSLAYCGVTKDDPRFKKALEWVSKNYTVDINPGRAEGAGGQGYYYYLVSMARALDALGVDNITDSNGKAHDWRAEIARALANRQRADGSWGSDFRTWMESDSNLDTAYALIALSYCQPKTK